MAQCFRDRECQELAQPGDYVVAIVLPSGKVIRASSKDPARQPRMMDGGRLRCHGQVRLVDESGQRVDL